jgi:hypothetical protein
VGGRTTSSGESIAGAATTTAAFGLPYRYIAAVAVCVPAVLTYNWWLIVPFRHGLLESVNSFFSDLEVKGAPDAALFGHLDVTAGCLFLAALLLVGPAEPRRRLERQLFMTFAIAVAVGGLFPFSCAEGTDTACRHAEWHLQLPASHYMHVLCSAVEFLTVSIAVLLAWRNTRRDRAGSSEAVVFRWLAVAIAIGYAPLAVAYFSDHLAALIEPAFFLMFSAAVVTEVAGQPWAET